MAKLSKNSGPLIQPHLKFRYRMLDMNGKCTNIGLNLLNTKIDFANCTVDLNFRMPISGDFLQEILYQFKKGKKFIIQTLAGDEQIVETMVFKINKILKYEIDLDYSINDFTLVPVKIKYDNVQFMHPDKE